MTTTHQLCRHGGELLLHLLEQSRLAIAATAMEELLPEAGLAFINTGALERHSVRRAVLAAGDDGPTFRDLTWQPDQNAYGYFDAVDGNIVLAPEGPMLFRVRLPWWLSWLATSLDLTNSGQPTELVPGHVWDIGDLWITRQRNIPVLFARRLRRETTFTALRKALRKRAGRSGGLILTSSRQPLQRDLDEPPFMVVPLWEVLTNESRIFAIDRALLLSPYTATSSKGLSTKPLDLAPDGRRLVINGGVTLNFKSDIHVKLIRRLVDGHKEGKRWRACELLVDAGSNQTTLARAFGAAKWKQLKSFLKSRNGVWGFDL